MSTVNMNLNIPTVAITDGPEWAALINACFETIDGHDHTAGKGVLITPDAMNISSDLSFSGNNLTDARSLRMSNQGSPLVLGDDIGCLSYVGDDLYFNDGNGIQVRITQNGAVAGTPGSIANLVSPATAAYVAANGSFVWQSDVNLGATMDSGSVTIREMVASGKGVTLQAPTSLAADYAITMPASAPASNLPVSMSAAGVLSAAQITLIQLVTAVQQALNPAGVILPYGGTSAPGGYLLCDGSSYLRADYPALYAAIGTAFGAADGTHFNVPDTRGRFLRGTDGATARDPDAASRTAMNAGGNVGDNIGSIQNDAFESHSHTYSLTSGGGGAVQAQGVNSAGITTVSTAAAGGNETRPINAYVNFIIKT